MSVIVSEMPDNCLECPLSYFDYYFTDLPLRCPLMNDRIEVDKIKRHQDCPLKSIDGLIEKIKTTMALRCKDGQGNVFINEVDLFEIIKEYCDTNEPTIIPADKDGE